MSTWDSLDERERNALKAYYNETVFPVLTPLAVDPGRPFPHISNLSMNLAVVLTRTGRPRTFRAPKGAGAIAATGACARAAVCRGKSSPVRKFVWIEDLIAANLESLFPGLEIVESHPFHVTRDAEVAIKELESDDLLETVEEAVWRRRFHKPVRLQTDSGISGRVLEILVENLGVDPTDVFKVRGPIDLARLRQLPSLDRPELSDPPFEPWIPPEFSRRKRMKICSR